MKFDGEMLLDCGLIVRMYPPSGWKLRKCQDGGPALWTAYNLGPDDDLSVGISIYLPGVVAPTADGVLYHMALARGLRWFAESQRREFGQILGDLGDDDRFEVYDIRGEYWNLLKVLYVDGVWRASGTRNTKLFVDQRGDGRLIQEIGIYAPSDSHPGYEQGLEALRGIAWREQSCRS